MLSPRKTRLAIVGVAAALILSGCSTAPSASSEPSDAPPTSREVQTMPDDRQVTVVEVLDPVTMIVTPVKADDELYGEEFIVHESTMLAPLEGECGYDEALTHAKESLLEGSRFVTYPREPAGGEWIDADGEHYAYIQGSDMPYAQRMIIDGMAVPTEAWTLSFERSQHAAQTSGTGLWAICPDFGA